MNYICFDGNTLPAGQPVLLPANRAYRYGDGLFETMRVVNGNILLADYHFQRFFSSLELMKMIFPSFLTKEEIIKQVVHLCRQNKCEQLARIRLSVFGGNGNLYESQTVQYIIECWPLNPAFNQLNKEGLLIGVFSGSQKSSDPFSNLKSGNFLPYVMAAKYAKENGWDDCLVTNVHGRIADATIANLFLVQGKEIITPALGEGCINGVMRRHLIEQLKKAGYQVKEQPVTVQEVKNADEVFLTNAISGIRWVRQFDEKKYTNALTAEIYRHHIEPLWK